MTKDKSMQVLARWNEFSGKRIAGLQLYHPKSDSFYFISNKDMNESKEGVVLGVKKSDLMTKDDVLLIAGADVATCSIFENQYVIDTCKKLTETGIVKIQVPLIDPSEPDKLNHANVGASDSDVMLCIQPHTTLKEFEGYIKDVYTRLDEFERFNELVKTRSEFLAKVGSPVVNDDDYQFGQHFKNASAVPAQGVDFSKPVLKI